MRSDFEVPAPAALTVVIPSFNSAQWLPSTLDALADAVNLVDISVDVVVVDDGSTDSTVAVIEALRSEFPGRLTVLWQPHQGRFMARWAGITAARSDLILLLDSRVLIAQRALSYVLAEMESRPTRLVWNGHIEIAASAPLVGRFWDVPTYVFWGRYLRSPQAIDLTATNFDSAPKGTTSFLAPKATLVEAFTFAWPKSGSQLGSDDTKVLRRIANSRPIRLDPNFSAIYRPRTTVKSFVRHTFDRGTLFVDSYAGTSNVRSLAILALILAPVVVGAAVLVLALVGAGGVSIWLLAAAILLSGVPVVLAVWNRCPPRSVLAYLVYLPVFIGPFWAGLARGIYLHRSAFGASRSASGLTTNGSQAE